MPGDHARISPSALSRTFACPGSVQLSEGQPDSTSAAAELGTKLHSIAEYMLIHKTTPPDWESLTNEQCGWVQTYVDECRRIEAICHGDDK